MMLRSISRAGSIFFICIFIIIFVQCSHGLHGRARRHRHHERKFYEDHRNHRRQHSHHGFHSQRSGNNLVAENHVLDNSLKANEVTEDQKKPGGQNGLGSPQWALTYQGMQQESSTINNTVSNVTAQLGGTAFLPCRVGHLGDRQISWIRRRDWHVLTSGPDIYTHDHRFSVLHTAGSQDWTLHIKYVSDKDNGTYECQVSTGTGIISLFVNLAVVTPEAHIPGRGQYHVNHGSPISLTCIIKQSPTPPQYVSWYHNGELLNYLRDRPDVSIKTSVTGPNMSSSVSILEVASANDKHSGNYTCSADNTLPASTMVFVSQGDKTAAVQRIDSGSRGALESEYVSLLILLASAALWSLLTDR